MDYDSLQNKIQCAQYLDFGKLLELIFNRFKEVWMKGFLMILTLFIAAIIISLFFSFIGIGPDLFEMQYQESFNIFNELKSNSYSQLPQSILIASFTIGLLAGFYRILKQLDLKKLKEDDMFYYFKRNYTQKILMLGIIYSLISVLAQSLYVIPYIYAFVPLSFFAVVFSNNPELSEIEIIKISFSLGTKKWLLTFGLILLTGIIGMLGVLACGIGIFFTISIIYLPVYFVYRDVVGFEDLE